MSRSNIRQPQVLDAPTVKRSGAAGSGAEIPSVVGTVVTDDRVSHPRLAQPCMDHSLVQAYERLYQLGRVGADYKKVSIFVNLSAERHWDEEAHGMLCRLANYTLSVITDGALGVLDLSEMADTAPRGFQIVADNEKEWSQRNVELRELSSHFPDGRFLDSEYQLRPRFTSLTSSTSSASSASLQVSVVHRRNLSAATLLYGDGLAAFEAFSLTLVPGAQCPWIALLAFRCVLEHWSRLTLGQYGLIERLSFSALLRENLFCRVGPWGRLLGPQGPGWNQAQFEQHLAQSYQCRQTAYRCQVPVALVRERTAGTKVERAPPAVAADIDIDGIDRIDSTEPVKPFQLGKRKRKKRPGL